MQTIRSCGKINIIDNIPRENGLLVTKDFLALLAKGIVKYSAKYMSLVHESPFSYHERQLSSMLAPALAEVSEAFLMEVPTSRKDKKRRLESHGWVDYWAYYRNIDFFIELKHSYASFKGGTITETTNRRWRKANIQTRDCAHDLVALDGSRGIIPLPLQVIPIYETVRIGGNALGVDNLEVLVQLQEQYHCGLKPKPNWSYLWVLHEKLAQRSHEWSETSARYYPAVLLVANVPKLTLGS